MRATRDGQWIRVLLGSCEWRPCQKAALSVSGGPGDVTPPKTNRNSGDPESQQRALSKATCLSGYTISGLKVNCDSVLIKTVVTSWKVLFHFDTEVVHKAFLT